MHWLSKQSAWARCRELEVITRSAGTQGIISTNSQEDIIGDSDKNEDEGQLAHGHRKKKIAFLPSLGIYVPALSLISIIDLALFAIPIPPTPRCPLDIPHTVYYHGHWLRITRTKRVYNTDNAEELIISVMARNNSILKRLIFQAKREYEADMENKGEGHSFS
jgi:mitochondrial chaperone BCS1